MTIDIDAMQAADNEAYMNKNRALRVVDDSVDAAEVKSSETKKELNLDEKIYELEEFVDTLFLTNETIKPQNRILKIRDYSKRNNLGLKEDELRKFLWDGRKRSKGEVEYFTQDNIIKAPQEKWFWENILMLERTNLINALPKVGKTTLLLEMIGKWSRGAGEFLGEKFIGKCPDVVIIGTDMPKSDWMPMLHKFGLAQSVGKDEWKLLDPIKVLITQSNPLHLDEDGFNQIANILNKLSKPILLLDSYAKCCPAGVDERTNHFAEPLAQLQEVAAPFNATPLIIHHSGKAKTNSAVEASRGHTSLTGGVSQIVALKWLNKDEDINDERVLLHTEGRGRGIRKVIQQNERGFDLEGDYEEVIAEKQHQQKIDNLNERQEIVFELCKERSPVHTTYIEVGIELKKEEGKVVADRSCRRVLDQLVKQGLLEVKKKVGESGKENWYFLKNKPKDI